MDQINIDDQIKADIERYTSMLEMFKSGKAKTGELDNGNLADKTPEAIQHVENIIRELRALLRRR
jgi:hypothetical protein